jgi:hypothetical protein
LLALSTSQNSPVFAVEPWVWSPTFDRPCNQPSLISFCCRKHRVVPSDGKGQPPTTTAVPLVTSLATRCRLLITPPPHHHHQPRAWKSKGLRSRVPSRGKAGGETKRRAAQAGSEAITTRWKSLSFEIAELRPGCSGHRAGSQSGAITQRPATRIRLVQQASASLRPEVLRADSPPVAWRGSGRAFPKQPYVLRSRHRGSD